MILGGPPRAVSPPPETLGVHPASSLNADKMVVLSGGRVAEVGSPSGLKDEGGIFSRMVSLQTDSGDWSL